MFDLCFISHCFGGGADKYCYDLIKLNPEYNILFVKKHWEEKFTYEYYKNSTKYNQYDLNYLDIEYIHHYKVIHINSFIPYKQEDIIQIMNIQSAYKMISIHDFGLLCKFQHDPNLIPDNDKLKIWEIISNNIQQIICVSNFVKEVFIKHTNKKNINKLIVINNPDIRTNNLSINSSYKVDKNEFRIACIGSLNEWKGLNILHHVKNISEKNNEKFKFYLIGNSNFYPSSGEYNIQNFNSIIQNYKPHLLWFPTIVDETYSYTYTIALATSIPIFSSHKGAFIERSEISNKAYTFDTINPETWYQILKKTHIDFIDKDYTVNLNTIDFTIYPNKINDIYKDIIHVQV
jgi:glycosyltransferase involved in cell wall biosynthesis